MFVCQYSTPRMRSSNQLHTSLPYTHIYLHTLEQKAVTYVSLFSVFTCALHILAWIRSRRIYIEDVESTHINHMRMLPAMEYSPIVVWLGKKTYI